jgi:hypothetical protein
MAAVQLFRDVSHYDYDRGQTSVSNYPMIIAKATEGDNFTDPRFTYWVGKHKYVAVYHWIDTSPIDRQVDDVVRVIGDRHPIMWDAEASGATVSRIVSMTKQTRARGGIVKACYLPHLWWEQLGRPSLTPITDVGLFIINAWYGHGYGLSAPGWDAYGGVKPKILQYTSTPFDMNAFYGTEDQLLELWGFKEEDMPLSAEDLKKISDLIDQRIRAANIPHQVWHHDELADVAGRSNAVSAANALELTRNAVLAQSVPPPTQAPPPAPAPVPPQTPPTQVSTPPEGA